MIRKAFKIAGGHHEKWDGRGYPFGIQGTDIPLIGRICAVADVFDALSSARPYKQAWTFEETMEELRKLKGTHFEPKLVDAFLDVAKDVKAVYEER